MRRNLARLGCFNNTRRGVMVSVIRTKRMVQSPVVCVMYSTGLARVPERTLCARSASGMRQTTNRRGFTQRGFIENSGDSRQDRPSHHCYQSAPRHALVIFPQVHAGVEAGDLVAVAVELERLAAGDFAQPALA